MSALPRGVMHLVHSAFSPRAVELWTWLMPPSDNGQMNKPPHLDAFVQTMGNV